MSKSLDALKRLANDHRVVYLDNNTNNYKVNDDYSIIKKELKALEILKAFDFEIEDYTEDLNGSVCVKQRRIILDDDEIDLLKEVLL